MAAATRVDVDALLRAAHWISFVVLVVLLAAMLYLDHLYNVSSAFPLKGHPTPPLITFLMLGTVGFPLGATVLIDSIADWIRASLSESWPTVPGRVTYSDMTMTLGKGPRFIADVRYEYEVAAKRYTGMTVRFSQGNYRFSENAQAVVDRYPAGSAVEVRYDPADPRIAALESSPGGAIHGLWLAVTFLLMPFLAFYEPFRAMING